MSEHNGSPRSISSTCELDTSTGWESIPLRSSLSRVTLSLNTLVVGELDELEEDVGWLRSCLESVIDVEEGKLEEKLDDKPGTPRSEQSSPYYIVFESRFWWDVVFDRWSTRKNIRFHRKAFRATILLACFRGLSLSTKYPLLWHTPLPLHASALLHWLLWPSWVYTTSSRYPFRQNSNPFLLILCIDAPESTTNFRSSGF